MLPLIKSNNARLLLTNFISIEILSNFWAQKQVITILIIKIANYLFWAFYWLNFKCFPLAFFNIVVNGIATIIPNPVWKRLLGIEEIPAPKP